MNYQNNVKIRSETETLRFPTLDILRIFACLSVILYHYHIGSIGHTPWQTFSVGEFEPKWTNNPVILNWTRYGYMGVDLFFLLSGFVIFKTAKGRTSKDFLLARLDRLFPIYLIVAPITYLIYRFFSPVKFSSLLALNDLSFSNYWKGQAQLVPATWTLSIEITFYLIIALALVLITLVSKIFEVPRESLLFGVFVSWLLLSWIIDLKMLPTPFNLLALGGYLPYFLAGGIIAGIAQNSSKIPIIGKIFLYLIVFNSVQVRINERIFGSNSTSGQHIFVVGMTLLILTLVSLSSRIGKRQKGLTRKIYRILEKVAVATYPLYLLHQQIGLFIITFLTNHVYSNKLVVSTLVLTLLLLFSIFLIDNAKKIFLSFEKIFSRLLN